MFLLRQVVVTLMAVAAALGAVVFMLFNVFYKRRVRTHEDYIVLKETAVERSHKRVLVLGLDGAGKSSFLQELSGETRKTNFLPTCGFNFIRLQTPTYEFDFLEIGGKEDLRAHWAEFLRKAHILLYVVDCSDRKQLPRAKDELHRLLKLNTQLPVVVLGNKQDKLNAVGESGLREALGLRTSEDQRKLFLHIRTDGETQFSRLQNLLVRLCD